MPFRTIVSLMLIVLFAAACRLKPIEEAESAITEEVAALASATNTITPLPTFTSQPSQTTTQAVSNNTVATAAAPNCVPQNPQWALYIVQAGDSLSTIASRTGATVNMLVTVNCIANPNVISVGTQLRVPRLPATSTPTATASSNSGIPVIDIGLPTNDCRVASRGVQANVWGPGDGNSSRVAYLKVGALVSVADNAYVVDIPNQNYDGWVSMSEAVLIGVDCPTVNAQLPVVGGQGTVPSEGCWVVKTGTATINIYYALRFDEQPIAIMGTFLPYRGLASNAYQVDIPEFGHIGFVGINGLSLQGNDCDAPQPAQQCLITSTGNGQAVITPSTVRSATCVGLQVGIVTVTWAEAPSDFQMVEFWRVNANGMTDVIGVDYDPSNGASIQWEVHASMPPSLIYTIVYGGTNASDSGQLSVYIGQ